MKLTSRSAAFARDVHGARLACYMRGQWVSYDMYKPVNELGAASVSGHVTPQLECAVA